MKYALILMSLLTSIYVQANDPEALEILSGRYTLIEDAQNVLSPKMECPYEVTITYPWTENWFPVEIKHVGQSEHAYNFPLKGGSLFSQALLHFGNLFREQDFSLELDFGYDVCLFSLVSCDTADVYYHLKETFEAGDVLLEYVARLDLSRELEEHSGHSGQNDLVERLTYEIKRSGHDGARETYEYQRCYYLKQD